MSQLPLQPAVAASEDESPLVRKLLQQTEENRELNAWRVRVQTEQNAYQAISGEPGVKQLVTMPDGTNGYFNAAQIGQMTREGRLLCPTGLPCRVVERDTPLEQQLPTPKQLQCEEDGRRCKFVEADLLLRLRGGSSDATGAAEPEAEPAAGAAGEEVEGEEGEEESAIDFGAALEAARDRMRSGGSRDSALAAAGHVLSGQLRPARPYAG